MSIILRVYSRIVTRWGKSSQRLTIVLGNIKTTDKIGIVNNATVVMAIVSVTLELAMANEDDLVM